MPKKIPLILISLFIAILAAVCVLNFLPKGSPAAEGPQEEPELSNRMSLFCEGLLCVKKDGKWGYIDRDGNEVIPLQFTDADPFEENGIARVKTDSGVHWIDTEGNFVDRPEITVPEETGDAIWYQTSYQLLNRFGLKDQDGNILIEPEFTINGIQSVGRFTENGLAAVYSPGKGSGYVNKKGEFVIPQQFSAVRNFSDIGLAAVSRDHQWGYIDSSGKFVIEPQFDSARDFTPYGLAAVEVNDQWGVINSKGKFVIEPSIDRWISDFGSDGLALVYDDDRHRFINKRGKTVHLLPENAHLNMLSCGYDNGTLSIGYVNDGSSYWWFIFDRDGNIVVSKDQYDTFRHRWNSDFGNGIM